MGDDLDVEALLEAPYQGNNDSNHSKNSPHSPRQSRRRVSRSRSVSRERSKDRNKESDSRSRRHRDDSRGRYRDRSGDRHRDRYSGRNRRYRSRSRSSERRSRHHRSRERSRRYDRDRSRSRSPRRKTRSPSPEISEYDRDQRTVFVQQLAARLKQRELYDFFSKVGKVREAKIVSDRNSGRSKGVGYIEFYDRNCVATAIGLTGQKLLGIPIIVEHTEAEKNRIAMASEQYAREQADTDIPYHRLYVGSVHFNLSEDDLKRVFEPFGPIEFVNLHKDPETGRSRGFGFVQFKNGDDAKKALEQMNGHELNGRPIRVGLVTQKSNLPNISLDDSDNPGFALTSQSRTELMQKLARQDENLYLLPKSSSPQRSSSSVLAASRSIILKNMFNPSEETSPNWVKELEEDVVEECKAYGTVRHIQVIKDSEGEIYLKFSEVSFAEKAVKSLNGRWFGGRQVIADFIPEKLYDAQFPKAASL